MSTLVSYVADHRFAELFRDELGWDRASGAVLVEVAEERFQFQAVAQKRGFQVLHCNADRRALFNRALLRKVQQRIVKQHHEHILIYSCTNPYKQVWQWAVRLPDGRKLRHREHPFFSGAPPAPFLSRLGGLRFELDEEKNVTLVDALDRVRQTLDVSPELNLFAKRPFYAVQSDRLAEAMAAGEAGAFDKFILLHRPLARHYSKWLQSCYGMEPEEAEQIGVMGLIKAARRYEPQRGAQFSTYAVWWIRQFCRRLGPDTALLVRLPTHAIGPYYAFRRELELAIAEFGPRLAREELSARDWTRGRFIEQWHEIDRVLNVRSLSDRREPEYHEARNLAIPVVVPIDEQIREERATKVRAAIETLSARDARVLRWRHGIDCRPHTLEEIGQKERITRERVRQIQKRAEERLRRRLEPAWVVRGEQPPASSPASRTHDNSVDSMTTWQTLRSATSKLKTRITL